MPNNSMYRTLVELAINEPSKVAAFVREHPASMNLKGPNGELPLHYVAIEGSLQGVESLLAAGAHVDTTNEFGDTALADAVYLGNREMVAALLKAGADPNRQQGMEYVSPMHIAAENSDALCDLLREYGGNLDLRIEGEPSPREILRE